MCLSFLRRHRRPPHPYLYARYGCFVVTSYPPLLAMGDHIDCSCQQRQALSMASIAEEMLDQSMYCCHDALPSEYPLGLTGTAE